MKLLKRPDQFKINRILQKDCDVVDDGLHIAARLLQLAFALIGHCLVVEDC